MSNESYTIREASISDLERVTELEGLCFPPAEAASLESFRWRLETYPRHFLLLEKDGELISFVNGPVTKEKDLCDEMYDSPAFCDNSGEWQMVFGVATRPDHQGKGYGSLVMKEFIQRAREQGLKGVVLTCKEAKIGFYERFGYKDEGLSASVHGGVPWHQMRITF